jgi:hypothetical protein
MEVEYVHVSYKDTVKGLYVQKAKFMTSYLGSPHMAHSALDDLLRKVQCIQAHSFPPDDVPDTLDDGATYPIKQYLYLRSSCR